MKVRVDFVTNSSSSSFIVISNEDYTKEDLELLRGHLDDYAMERFKEIGIFEKGKHQFGWEEEKSYDFESKINFLLILVGRLASSLKDYEDGEDHYYIDKSNYEEYSGKMKEYDKNLTDALSEIGIETIDWKKIIEKMNYKNDNYAYIDHQSNIFERDYSDLLESVENIKEFLFNDKSCIITGNDNVYHEDRENNEYESEYYICQNNYLVI